MILKVLADIYRKIVLRRNRLFDTGKLKIVKCGVPVFSVGNISVGGTGKTPFVKMLAGILIELGHKPAIIGKGYGRKSRGEAVVSFGKELLATWQEAGDEMIMVAESLNVPVLVHNKKYLAALSAEKKFDIDCIIVDDGFQHRWLHRDLDIVLLDKKTLENPQLLPSGRLREPIESINRADVVCLMGIDESPQIRELPLKPGAKVFQFKSELGLPYLIGTNSDETFDISLLKNKKIAAVSGIGNPDRFEQSLNEKEIYIDHHFKFRDHFNYPENSIRKLVSYCKKSNYSFLLTTEKDAVKLKRFAGVFNYSNIQCLVFPLELDLTSDKDKFINIIKSVFN